MAKNKPWIHLVRLSEGKELPRFQHFRSTKTSNKFLNAWGKIKSAETLLDENMWVACMERLRYDSLSQKYQGTSVQVLIALNGIVFLVFLILAEYHLKHILKEPTIRNSYQFPNVPSHKWQNWKVDNGSPILSGLVVKLNNSK